jgi:hypothetical protein
MAASSSIDNDHRNADRDSGNPQTGCANACNQQAAPITMSTTAIQITGVMAIPLIAPKRRIPWDKGDS